MEYCWSFFQLKTDNLVTTCKDVNELLITVLKGAKENNDFLLEEKLKAAIKCLEEFKNEHLIWKECVADHEQRIQILEKHPDENSKESMEMYSERKTGE